MVSRSILNSSQQKDFGIFSTYFGFPRPDVRSLPLPARAGKGVVSVGRTCGRAGSGAWTRTMHASAFRKKRGSGKARLSVS